LSLPSDSRPTVTVRGDTPDPNGLTRGARGALAAALLAVFVGALDLTVIATILPRMVSDLRINTADIDRYIWVVNAYLLAYIVTIPIVGRLSDLIGRRSAFLASIAVFVAGSLWCASADNLQDLIIGRAIQGAGGGALLPVTMALIGDVMPPRRRTASLGLVGAIDTLGWVLGPLWGAGIVGVLASQATPWRWVFTINVPLGILTSVAIVVAGRAITSPPVSWSLRRLDLVGTALLAAALLLINLGLSSGGELGAATGTGARALGGTTNPLASYLLPLLAGGGAALGAFVWWERRASSPIVPPALLRRPRFAAAISANLLAGSALIVAMVNTPIVVALLVDEDRISSTSALMLAPFTLLMAALSFGGGLLSRRFGERRTAIIGVVLVAAGYAVVWIGLRSGDYVSMVPGLAIAGAGFGLLIAPIGAAALDAAKPGDRGIAAGLTLVFRLLGMTIGISALTAVGVRRLATLTDRLEIIVRQPNESTAEFLVRQNTFVEENVIPISLQVVRETFLIAGCLALLALVPIWWLGRRSEQTG